MEKRLILAFALTILVFIGFSQFQKRALEQPVPKEPPRQVQTQSQDIQKPAQPVPVESTAPQAVISPEDTTAVAQILAVKGELYRAAIENRGAVLSGWELNQYKSAKNRVFEMIATSHGGETRTFPASFLPDDPELAALANNELYQVLVNGEPYDGREIVPPVTAVFRLKRGGLSIEKRFSFEKDNCVVNLSAVYQKDAIRCEVLSGKT
jgi:YidC/Oxa1 family membrane protein insertase